MRWPGKADAKPLTRVAARVRWIVVVVALLSAAAILWVLLRPEMWTSCLVLVAAAVPLAIIGRDSR